MGTCYKLDPSIGNGYYWIYTHENLFSIVIHDFYFHDDYFYESPELEYYSVTYYESVSGEELNPYHRLNPGCIKSYWCSHNKYRAIFHKNIPIRTIGIEFMPKYCNDFLAQRYYDYYVNPRTALISINVTRDFPEMVLLLYQLYHYRGTGMSAKLFYEGKVSESMSLIYERYENEKLLKCSKVSKDDIQHLKNVATYINSNYALNLTLDKLSKIACMGLTKLKKTFKDVYKCTITEYIQYRRMEESTQFLTNTDMTIGQVANIVGYKSASRFAELFKKNFGIRPMEYRNFSRR